MGILPRLTPYLFLLPALAVLGVFVYYPVAENFRFSLYQWGSFTPEWKYVGLGNYLELWQDPVVYKSLLHNTLYAVISVVFQVGLALGLAALLEQATWKAGWKWFFRTALFLPSILPITVVGFMWQLLYQPAIGLLEQLLRAVGLPGLVRAWLGEEQTALFSVIAVSQWQWTGYIMVLFIVAIQAIPNELFESMKLDGANRWQQFWKLTVPAVSETTLVMLVITVLGAFKVFDIVWVMTVGGPNHSSEVLGTYMYQSAFRNDQVGYASSIATLIFVITLGLSVVQIRLQGRQ